MTGRERLKAIIAGKPADRCGFWLGNPHPDTWPILHKHFGTSTDEELRLKLKDDFRWIPAGGYKHPEGKPLFPAVVKKAHGEDGPFAKCEDPAEIERADWGSPEHFDFSRTLEALKNAGEFYRASGFWTSFYHDVMALFGMENYMEKMITSPSVVHAVTDHVCELYYEGNKRFYEQAGDMVDGFFFGNDFGTQLDLICGTRQFDQFIMPWFRKFTEQAHDHGYQVILHSCGSIFRVIDRFVEMKVDCLHPLQARARNMDADYLARHFKGRIAFMGGIDTQELLVRGTPQDIVADVARVKALLGPRLIVSPSHEALLPNVNPANIEAMAKAAVGEA